MRYYWLRDKENQKLFDFYWDKSVNNEVDYYTKHHSAKYHTEPRPKYVHDKPSTNSAFSLTLPSQHHLQGCVRTKFPTQLMLTSAGSHVFRSECTLGLYLVVAHK